MSEKTVDAEATRTRCRQGEQSSPDSTNELPPSLGDKKTSITVGKQASTDHQKETEMSWVNSPDKVYDAPPVWG